MFKLLFGALIAFTVGFLGYSAFTGHLSQLYQIVAVNVQPVTNMLQPIITYIQNTWISLPETIRGVILLGIPTAFATFFAWTKGRAMEKLQQTQLEASQQISQITSETSEQKQALETQVTALQAQINDPKHLQQLTDNLTEAEKLVGQKQQIINNQTATINELHRVIEDLKMKEKTVTVVK